jgi:hypothetical protein
MTDQNTKTSEPETLEQRSRRVAKILHAQDDDYAGETVAMLIDGLVEAYTKLAQADAAVKIMYEMADDMEKSVLRKSVSIGAALARHDARQGVGHVETR